MNGQFLVGTNADIKIEAPPDGRYAAESTDGAGMVATKTVSPTDAAFDRSTYADGTRPGCRLRFSCYSGKTHVGVQLKIKDNSRNQSRTTALPDIYQYFFHNHLLKELRFHQSWVDHLVN